MPAGLVGLAAGWVIVAVALGQRPAEHGTQALLDSPNRLGPFVPVRHQHGEYVSSRDL